MPMVIMGDFNVTRYLSEHSSGSSLLTDDMKEFNSCISELEVEDIYSSGFHFTWTKSLKNPKCGKLKTLDIILINEEVMNSIPQANGIFLPYVISDHSPAILCLPHFMVDKPKSFRFMNFIADKKEFLPTVEKGWEDKHVWCSMYCLQKKLKGLKKELRRLSWSDGNIFDKVKHLKQELKTCQAQIDMDPHNANLREAASKLLVDYEAAKHDEFLILQQKTKIKWLSEGDKNTKGLFLFDFLGWIE
ncbi:uncharacterized protein [Rutidosis leptorrhynchoides]|uniref:uncharacterized protein n=1 Tax=Rutidosis leptorrhynchoides TaxID=125765 RepID=UPI003A991B5F